MLGVFMLLLGVISVIALVFALHYGWIWLGTHLPKLAIVLMLILGFTLLFLIPAPSVFLPENGNGAVFFLVATAFLICSIGVGIAHAWKRTERFDAFTFWFTLAIISLASLVRMYYYSVAVVPSQKDNLKFFLIISALHFLLLVALAIYTGYLDYAQKNLAIFRYAVVAMWPLIILFPFLLLGWNSIVLIGWTKYIFSFPWTKGILLLWFATLLVSIAILFYLNLQTILHPLFKVGVGFFTLVVTAVMFGVTYYALDASLEGNDVPGFANYSSPDIYSHSYRIFSLTNAMQAYLKSQNKLGTLSNEENPNFGPFDTPQDLFDHLASMKVTLSDNDKKILIGLNNEGKEKILITRGEEKIDAPSAWQNEFEKDIVIANKPGSTLPEKDKDKTVENIFNESPECKCEESSAICTEKDNPITGYACFNKHIKQLKESYTIKVTLTGEADPTRFKTLGNKYGSNYDLSVARAEKIKEELLNHVAELESNDIIIQAHSNDTENPMRQTKLMIKKLPLIKIESKIEVEDRTEFTSHISLADAMFYSSYSITNGGYGMTPLDGTIKFLTIVENFFEGFIITVLIASAISENNNGGGLNRFWWVPARRHF